MLMLLNKLLLLLIGRDMSLASGAHKLDFAEQAASCWGSVYVASDTSAPQHEGSPGGNTKHKYVLFYIALPSRTLPCLALPCIRPFYSFINCKLQNAFPPPGPPMTRRGGGGPAAPQKKKTRRLLPPKKARERRGGLTQV